MTQEQQTASPQIAQSDPGVASASSAWRFDPGFSRNMKILAGVFVVAVIGVAYAVTTVRSAGAGKPGPSQMDIPGGAPVAAGVADPSPLTTAEVERLLRVHSQAAEDAARRGVTYIPRDSLGPLEPRAPSLPSRPDGPGPGYQVLTGDPGYGLQPAFSGQQVAPAIDPQREADIRRGLELQISALAARNEAPDVSSAGLYTPRQPSSAAQATQQDASAQRAGGAAPAAQTASAASSASGAVIIRALAIAGARLVSPIDTSRGEFVSAVIDSGPLAGAYLVGGAKVVPGENGVTVNFTRMTLRDRDYRINAVGLDPASSADPVAAEVDRKLMQRFVLPVIFETAQAYAGALARPGQTVVVGPGGTTVSTPGAASKEAAAAGVASGLRKLGESSAQARATAFMPVGSGVPILFLDAVVEAAR